MLDIFPTAPFAICWRFLSPESSIDYIEVFLSANSFILMASEAMAILQYADSSNNS